MRRELQDYITENGLEGLGVFYGSYKGTVASNKDPEGRGRIKVNCPEIYGDDTHDYWALPKTGYTGKGIGSYFIPDEGASIWVSFEKGDSRFPVWEGGWWSSESPSDDPEIKRIRTSTGLQLTFNDKDGNIEIKTNNNSILIDEAEDSIRILQGDSSVKLTTDYARVDFKDNHVELNNIGASIISDKISIGKLNGSTYKAVEGETIVGLLENLIDELLLMTVNTSFGPSSTIVNPAPFVAIKNQLDTMLSEHVTID